MTRERATRLHALSLLTAIAVLGLVSFARQPSARSPDPQKPQPNDERPSADAPAKEGPTDAALFRGLMDHHWRRIFPTGQRNVGGPQFFKYVVEELASSHELFERYSRFYCGVSGAIVDPSYPQRYDVVKVKDRDGRCVVGKYYRCCWPCACDVMKHARVEPAKLRLPKDPSGREKTYWVLTIGDPCHRCDSTPCEDLPAEVQAYACRNKLTSNGLRVRDGRLTSGKGRLVFALLHEAAPAEESELEMTPGLLERCGPRIDASPEELKKMGGMGNIFVEVALVNSGETLANSIEDLCD